MVSHRCYSKMTLDEMPVLEACSALDHPGEKVTEAATVSLCPTPQQSHPYPEVLAILTLVGFILRPIFNFRQENTQCLWGEGVNFTQMILCCIYPFTTWFLLLKSPWRRYSFSYLIVQRKAGTHCAVRRCFSFSKAQS